MPWSNAEMLSAADIIQKLLEQMQCLCVTVQDMGSRMDGRCAEDQKRKEENLLLKTEMCARIDEELQKEESARQMVQNDLSAMKEDIRQIQLGSGRTVCCEARTAVGKGSSGTTARHCCSS